MHWARGGRPDNSEAIADAMTWGAPAEFIDALRADDTEHLFAVSPSCWPTITAWLLIETQWRAGPGGAIGLDYPAVFQTLDRCRVDDPDGEVFAGIQLMEAAALNEIHRKR